jgi:uncharacterized membrane protein
MRKSEIIMLVIIAMSFIFCAAVYPLLPERMATHWDAWGQANGYSGKTLGVFLMPAVMLAIALLFIAIPRIDPLKANIAEFRPYYGAFIIIMTLFMLSITFQIVLWNMGIRINPNILMSIGLGVLFYYTGVLLEKSKRNWSIGIRTSWTLSSDVVWDKTHRLGGKLFKLAGVAAFLGVFYPNSAIYLILVPVLAAALFLTVYSYFVFREEEKKEL